MRNYQTLVMHNSPAAQQPSSLGSSAVLYDEQQYFVLRYENGDERSYVDT